MPFSGNAGIRFDLLETDTTTATGNVTQEYVISTDISDLPLTSMSLIYTVSGSVGTTAFDFDLNAVSNQSGAGYTTQVVRNNSGDYTTLQMISIHNTHLSNNLIFGSSSANNLFTWQSTSNYITIPAGCCISFCFSSALTISTNGKINLLGSSASTTFKIYLLGT